MLSFGRTFNEHMKQDFGKVWIGLGLMVCLTTNTVAQKVKYSQKISPTVQHSLTDIGKDSLVPIRITISNQSTTSISSNWQLNGIGNTYKVYILKANKANIQALANHPDVFLIEKVTRFAREEQNIQGLEMHENEIRLLQQQYPNLQGEGIQLSLKEQIPDTMDIDYADRFTRSSLGANQQNPHAGIMATMIGGAGNTWYNSKGVAPAIRMFGSSFSNLLPDTISYFQQNQISIQNHSYGVGVENFYGTDAAAYDVQTSQNNQLLHVFSSGNSGDSASNAVRYQQIKRFANITGSFKTAKNVITIGATNKDGSVASRSSKGPLYDGRIAPFLVAAGEEGSSGAAALVSGTIALLQERAKQQYNRLPDAALIRAILIASAEDIGLPGPDYASGYGRLQAWKAMQCFNNRQWQTDAIDNGQVKSFQIVLQKPIHQLTVALSWNDLAATPGNTKALIQDIDMYAEHQRTGRKFFPFVNSTAPHLDSLNTPARTGIDSLNNHELIQISLPDTGLYNMYIIGKALQKNQPYAIAYYLTEKDTFYWTQPIHYSIFTPKETARIQWSTSFQTNSNIFWKPIGSSEWRSIRKNLNSGQKAIDWIVPDTTCYLQFMWENNQASFVSDTCFIGYTPVLKTGYLCSDSVRVFWNAYPNTTQYQLARLENGTMRVFQQTRDTSFAFSRWDYTGKHLYVQPVGRPASPRSFSIDYSKQGIGCYINSFLAIKNDQAGEIRLSMGTSFLVSSIHLEKQFKGVFNTIHKFTNNSNLTWLYSDTSLQNGKNSYRVRVQLEDGRVIYSNTETIYHSIADQFWIYPNPIQKGMPVQVISKDINDPATLLVLNQFGQLMQKIILDDVNKPLSTERLSRGLYFLRWISANGSLIETKKLLIQ